MTACGDGHARPCPPPQHNDRQCQRGAPWTRTILGSAALCLASLAVMIPWPLLGIPLMRSSFDEANEAFLLFGGITLFPLMILAFFGSIPAEVLIALFMLVWLAAAVLPNLWLRRRLGSWMAIGVLLGAQSAFSFAQAAMGALLILGKNV